MVQRLYLYTVIAIQIRIYGDQTMPQDAISQGWKPTPRKKAGRIIRSHRHLVTNLALALAALCFVQYRFAIPEIPENLAVGVGKMAPKLEVGRWIKGTPVPLFDKGTTYIIESWATWCVPCVQSIPHLTELQKKYNGQVKVIGIDIWEQDATRADQFVARQGARMDYAIAQDSVPAGRTFFEGKFAKAWIEGAGKYSVGIPLAYIVDGNGMIAWIGHPMDLDRPLEQIVAGSWDLAGAKANYEAELKEAMKTEPFKVAFYESERNQNWKGVAAACESLLRINPDEYADWAGRGFVTLYSEGKMPELAMSFAKKAIQESYKAEPRVLAVLALSLARTGAARNSPEMALAQEAADNAYRLAEGKKAFAMAAVARVLFAKGEKDKALELQRRALDNAVGPDEKADMQTLLDFMLGKK